VEKLKRLLRLVKSAISWTVWKPLELGEERAQINAKRLFILLDCLVIIFTLFALIVPATPKYIGEFHERLPPEAQHSSADEQAIALATATTQKAFSGGMGRATGNSNQRSQAQGGGAGEADRNTSMIQNRPGVNSGNQLAAGMKFTVRLLDGLNLSDQAVPVIVEVTRGVFNDSGGGIKEGSRLFGTAQFQNGSERAQIQFRSISDPSGIVRNIQGVALDGDGQSGVAGNIHSKSLRNTAGQFVTRFIGAYAEGSQQRDFFGNTRGGAENGLLNAVGETAKDRTSAYADQLKKEHQWIEVPKDKEIAVILTQTFTFNEPGVSP
jgi:hypothetical protein